MAYGKLAGSPFGAGSGRLDERIEEVTPGPILAAWSPEAFSRARQARYALLFSMFWMVARQLFWSGSANTAEGAVIHHALGLRGS